MKKFILLTALAFAALPATFLAQKLTFEIYAGPQYDWMPKARLISLSDGVSLEKQTGGNLYKRTYNTYEVTRAFRFTTRPLFNAGFRTRGKIGTGWSWAIGARIQGRQFEEDCETRSEILTSQPLNTIELVPGNTERRCDTSIFSNTVFVSNNMPVYKQYQLGIPLEFAYSFPSGKVDLFGEVVAQGQVSARVRAQTFESSYEIINGKSACIYESDIQEIDAQYYFKTFTLSAGGGVRWFVMSPGFMELSANRVMTGMITPLVNFYGDNSILKTFPWQFSLRVGYQF